MTITVTEDHIKRGVPRKDCFCPIALAMREQTGENWRVMYAYAVLDKRNDLNEPTIFWFPVEAKNFIYFFDMEETGKPFSFELEWTP